ncbi:bifunctional diaminohydroxyphosphoribosylaminopyrimidine deaminase/5-amino-6-(5-phosphoribosylamino)uracil reductase RibD [Anaerocolumna jejuensis]|uniref:bifunctional diaminohydroxyphosphoribosylaminopyrimidine deaminase/5-amino-6-(5-phosphoribosylamino)uracil reductase RibD n=1 Tax=Anaerocolumna jejuensis TaxID=259063 RepID=UPI003F7C4F31
MENTEYMRLALELAEKGKGFVYPNPMVGAVIVKDNKIIGQGYHERYGGLHAERNALAGCRVSPAGGVLYVTLEPCCHFGKTPPCTEAILQSGIKKVVIGCKDPNPMVAGKGIEQLRQQGIEVTEGVLEQECRKLNEVFFHYIETKQPYVVMKYAMTMDGKTAAYTGKSKWITGEPARKKVHQDRLHYSAIMTGIGTVLADNPLLTCRLENGRNPVRIICDTHLRTPLDSNIVKTAGAVPAIIATACRDTEKYVPYIKGGCRILPVTEKDGHLELCELMTKLGEESIDSILLEGGGMLNWSALNSGIVNKVQAYISPKLLGGMEAKTPISGKGAESPEAAFCLTNSTISRLGEDILIESEVVYPCLQE